MKADDDSLAKVPNWRATHARPKATVSDVADQIEHVRKIAGVDHVGIGSDFDGITRTSSGSRDVSKFPVIFAELARRGWAIRIWRSCEWECVEFSNRRSGLGAAQEGAEGVGGDDRELDGRKAIP